ncbi:MAG: hypothetical protein IT557_16620 [Alphaproteobacteria bacterium]|nr:hypothetical protein [Alphaproteobacteria bacterium]
MLLAAGRAGAINTRPVAIFMPHTRLMPVPNSARTDLPPAKAGMHDRGDDHAHGHDHGHAHDHCRSEHHKSEHHKHDHAPRPEARRPRPASRPVRRAHPLSLSAGWIDRVLVALPLIALVWAGVWWAMRPVFGS